MGAPHSRHCCVDAFELSLHRGRHGRLYGLGRFSDLRSRSQHWGVLIVGPEAYIRLYISTLPQVRSVWLFPRQLIDDVVTLNVGDELDSIELLDRPPGSGEEGYEAFVGSKARMTKPEIRRNDE
jgi:hypothetical protein